MLGLWSFRFALWYILFLMTQPHFRFEFLIPFRLGDIFVGGAVGFHVIHCLSNQRPILVFGPASRIALALLGLVLTTHYFNPNMISTEMNPDTDGLVKVAIITLLMEAQLTNPYRAFALLATMVSGTVWWLKGGVRLAQAGATWGSGDRLMGANVSIIQNPNDFAYQLCFMLPLYFLGYRLARKRWLKLGFAGMMAAAAFLALETGSRTGLLAFLCVGSGLAWLAWRNGQRELIFGGVAGVALLFTVFVSGGNIERFKTILTSAQDMFGRPSSGEPRVETADDGSARIRWIKIRAAWYLILDHPLLGVGTRPNKEVYWRDINAAGMVHNELMMAGRHMGIPGMFVYLSAILVPWVVAGRVRRRCLQAWPEVAAFAQTARLCLVVTVVGGFFSPSLFNFPHMMLMTSLCSVHAAVRRDLPAAPPQSLAARPRPPALRPATLPV
jgi:hypothetical protein